MRIFERTVFPPGASLDLRAAWDRAASEFIAWARRPGHDSYEQFHRDLFLELVPAPGSLTVDLGCGEGRLSRDLVALGHRVVGVDSSATMIEAARRADEGGEYAKADAAHLPLDDAVADVVVAFMSLHDMDNLGAAVAESARVLCPGGQLCVAIVHPLYSAGLFETADANAGFTIQGSYLAESWYLDEVERDGLYMQWAAAHRPLEAYVRAITAAGLLINAIREPGMPDGAIQYEWMRRWQRIPMFLHMRAVKPTTPR